MFRAVSDSVPRLSIGLLLTLLPCGAEAVPTQSDPAPRSRKVTTPSSQDVKETQTPVSQARVDELINQGKVHYKAARLKQALAKFEDALEAEPNQDEALGLAAITAFRLDSQEQARRWFLRRAELPSQKDSVKAFSYYRVALTYWRQLHHQAARGFTIKDGKVEFKLKNADLAPARENLRAGLHFVERALIVNANYAEAHNLKNLLHTEAAFTASESSEAARQRKLALDSLRKAIALQVSTAARTDLAAGDFSLATVRIGEIPRTSEEQLRPADEFLGLIEGGRPLKRVTPAFPSARPAKSKTGGKDASTTGVTDKGGAYSIGGGRGALTAAYAPGTVKVEVLISTLGNVVFAHIVDGRADINGAAILAARAWKFAPAKFEGSPVQVSGVITFDMKPGRSKPSSPIATPTPRPKS